MRLVPLAVLFVACGGGSGGDTDGPDITDDTDPPIDHTGEDIERYSVDGAFWTVTARFAYDDANDRHVSYVEPNGGPTPISLAFTIIDSEVAQSGVLDETTSCTVTLESDGPLPMAPWVELNGELLWTGFDLPANPTVHDGCKHYYGLPSEIRDNVGPSIAQWSWGVGVGVLTDDLAQLLEAQLAPSEWAALKDYVIGGALVSPLFADATADTGDAGDGVSFAAYALGYEVDGNFEVVVGGTGTPNPLSYAVVGAAETGVATGYYEVSSAIYTNAAVLGGPSR